jgi:thiosulfate dehydrogenase
VSGNAVDGSGGLDEDRYYSTYATMHYARAGDGDGDTDIDLFDFGAVQRCFGDPGQGAGCEFVDMDGDELMSLSDAESFTLTMTGPTAAFPAGYVLADPVRGGLLYDAWWKINGAQEPQPDVNHPLYPVDGPRAGSTTFRCKECHGWDYKGANGVYGSDILHFTGIAGVDDTALTPQQLFDLLKADVSDEGGHDMDSFGMSDRDVWDVVKMTLEKAVDADAYITPNGTFLGDPLTDGPNLYFAACWSCHGDGVDIGAVAAENPWEFFHKVRFGHPGSPMPSLELLGWSLQSVADIGAYTATLAP